MALLGIGVERAGQRLSSLVWDAMKVHKEGPVRPQIRPLAFNHLHTPFFTPMLSHPPPLTHPPSLLLPHAISLLYPHKKCCSKQLEFWVVESYTPTKL